MRRPWLLTAVAWLALAPLLPAQEALVVIVNLESGVTRLTREEATNIFMGRQKHLRPGLVALPVEQVAPGQARARFYELLVNLPLPQVRAYWARLYFSGQAQPPRQTESAAETLQVVAANKGAIGFVEQTQLDHRVKAVLVLADKGPL